MEPNSTLINGRGRYPGGPQAPLSVINVQSGLRYRFRVISMSCFPWFNFTIDGHRMTIIEVDGNEVHPVEVDTIPILAGQRYSVVVTANQPPDSYWIRSASNMGGMTGMTEMDRMDRMDGMDDPTFENGQNMAILRYKGASEQEPMSQPGPYELSFDEGMLHPLFNPGAPGIPEIGKADVNIQMFTGVNMDGLFTMNDVAYVQPSVPVLLQILSGARHPSQLIPNGSVYELPPNKVIELSFPNPTAAHHYPVSQILQRQSTLTLHELSAPYASPWGTCNVFTLF